MNSHNKSHRNSGGRIKTLACSPNEELILATTVDGQLFQMPHVLQTSSSNQNPTTTTTAVVGLKPDESPSLVSPVVSLFHGQLPITGLDVCARKPLVVTCGLDRTIKLWNYHLNTLEMVRYFR